MYRPLFVVCLTGTRLVGIPWSLTPSGCIWWIQEAAGEPSLAVHLLLYSKHKSLLLFIWFRRMFVIVSKLGAGNDSDWNNPNPSIMSGSGAELKPQRVDCAVTRRISFVNFLFVMSFGRLPDQDHKGLRSPDLLNPMQTERRGWISGATSFTASF